MSKLKKLFLSIVILLVAIQFIPVDRTVPAVNPSEEFAPENADAVTNILHKACYDCHSYETEYPWYASVAPVSFWLDHHIDEAREKVNFSVWNTYSKKDRNEILEDASEEVSEGDMPLTSYCVIHREANLTDAEKSLLVDFFDGLRGVKGYGRRHDDDDDDDD